MQIFFFYSFIFNLYDTFDETIGCALVKHCFCQKDSLLVLLVFCSDSFFLALFFARLSSPNAATSMKTKSCIDKKSFVFF